MERETAATMSTTAGIMRAQPLARRASEDAAARSQARVAATTAAAIAPASGRYIRRSAATSVAMGTMLEAGANVTKNHAAGKNARGHRHRPTAHTTTNAATIAIGSATSKSVIARGHP